MGAAQDNDRELESRFEAEVQRVARALWAHSDPYQGSTNIGGAERDGVFVGSDVVAVVEATVSRKLEKAKKDGKKLKELVGTLAKKYPLKAVKGYFVTKEEPQADQRDYIRSLNAGVVALSFAQLRGLLVDSHEYLSARGRYSFGSARNPRTGDDKDLGDYVPIGLLPISTAKPLRALSVANLADGLTEGESFVLLGDFGAGKSMTLHEVFRRLAAQHYKDSTKPFPVALNLRDHQAQRDPDEALRRHAQAIGFADSTQLVRAWRAGEVVLLLDGFDEIATSGWLGQAPNLRNVRHRSVELIRKFVDQSPAGAGLLVTGREHLFDSLDEMKSSLGLRNKPVVVLRTDEFSEEQVLSFLERMGWQGELPAWLPARPLLLGYLSASGSMSEIVDNQWLSQAAGWNMLLDRICEREAKIELGLDAGTVRRVMERLATLARCRGDGFGPLYKEDLASAFKQVCGYELDEGSYVIVQRMPGLGVADPTDGSRNFIDAALGDSARAGDLTRMVGDPGTVKELGFDHLSAAQVGELGLSVAALLSSEAGIDASAAIAAAVQFARAGGKDVFTFDSLQLALELGLEGAAPDLTVENLVVPHLHLSDGDADLGGVQFVSCLFEILDLTEYEGNSALPSFSSCMFGEIRGASSPNALPQDRFVDCDYGEFDISTRTTRGILAMPGLSDKQKVTLSILKKVYFQAGGGRRESALLRGLAQNQKSLVGDALQALVSAGLLIHSRSGSTSIYSIVRGQTGRVRELFENPIASHDPVLLSYK